MPENIEYNARNLDLSGRVVHSGTVVASPSAATETTIVTVTIPGDIAIITGVYLVCFAAYTVGTNGVSVNLKIRRTDTSGTTVKATGATTATAANLGALTVAGFDTGISAGQVYVGTMTVASGSASSAVSGVSLFALAI